MSNSVIFWFILLWYCWNCALSGDIRCNDYEECRQNATLTTCVDNEVCNIICNGTRSCYGTTFTCPAGAACNIHCEDTSGSQNDVCAGANIQATHSTELNLKCIGSKACSCMGHSCASSVNPNYYPIQCPLTGDCNLQMGGNLAMDSIVVNASASTGDLNFGTLDKDTSMYVNSQSLKASTIDCPLIGNCNFNMYARFALWRTQIMAQHTDGIVNITVSGLSSLRQATLYCPDAYHGNPNCLIRVIQDVNNADNDGMLSQTTIWANRSWEQVSLSSTGLSDPRVMFTVGFATMNCRSDSWTSCIFIWINGEYQCWYEDETSPCNIATPTNVVTGSDFTTLCNGTRFCLYYKFQCDEGTTCDILCSGLGACGGTSIACPTNGACNIEATGPYTNARALGGSQIDCGVTGDCTITNSRQQAVSYATIDGSRLNGSNLNLLDPTGLGGWAGATVHCPLVGDCNFIGSAPDIVNVASSDTSNVLRIEASYVPATVNCPTYDGSTPNCFIHILPDAFNNGWMHNKRIYAEGGFAQLTMTMDPSLPNDPTNPTYYPFGWACMWGSCGQPTNLTCDAGTCGIDYLNGVFQCIPAQESSGCNVANPDPIVTGSNFTFDIENGAVYKTFKCMDGVDCYINCNRNSSCVQGTFICPENALCFMHAEGWCAGCYAKLIGATNGDIFLDGTGDVPYPNFLLDASNTTGDATIYPHDLTNRGIFSHTNTHLHCPKSGKCHFQVEAPYSLNGTYIYTSSGTFLSFNASVNQALKNTNIYCPQTNFASEPQCVINVDSKGGTYTQLLEGTNIYAMGALANDLSITCDYTNTIEECYGDGLNPTLYCTGAYGSSCTLELVSGFSVWECAETASTCSNYCESVQTYEGADLIVECLGIVSAESGAVIDTIPLVDHFTIEFLLSMESLITGFTNVLYIGAWEVADRHPSIFIYSDGTNWEFQVGINKDGSDSVETFLRCQSQAMAV
eukprot:52519_1